MFDENFMRSRITKFYILFYITCFTAVIFQRYLLYETWAILLLNASLWVPQIIHSYVKMTRKGPNISFCCALLSMQIFLPLYLKIYSENILGQQTDLFAASIIILYMVI